MSDDLDDFFKAARAERASPSPDLMARVLADAYDLQPASVIQRAPAIRRPRRGFWRPLAEALGGAGALAGLGTAAVAGLYIGYASPSSLDWLTGLLQSTVSGDVQALSADDLFLTEG